MECFVDPTSPYHFDTMWEPRDFDEREYEKVLQTIASKEEGSTLMVKDNSIVVVGTVMKVWHTIKEWFGFENQTDPIRVNYELLKILRYGESHRYLEKKSISAWLSKLQQMLAKEQSHEKIATIIEKILLNKSMVNVRKDDVLDKEIRTFQIVHKKELVEPFWSRVFPQYFSRVTGDEAHLQYNRGRILFSSGQWKEAISELEKAVRLHSDPEWELLLVKAYTHQAQIQPKEAIELNDKALKLLRDLKTDKSDELLIQECREIEFNLAIRHFSELVKLGKYNKAIQEIKEACKHLSIPFEDFFLIENDRFLSRELTQEQYGRVQIALSKTEEFRKCCNVYLQEAIDPLYKAVKQQPSIDLYEELINACISLSEMGVEEVDYDRSEKFVDEALYHFINYKSVFPAALSSPIYAKLSEATQHLSNYLKEKRDFHGAMRILEKLNVLGEKSPALKAETFYVIAHLEEAGGNDIQALIEIHKACHLNSKPNYKKFENEIIGKITKNLTFDFSDRQGDEILELGEQLVSESSEDPGRNLVLAKAYLNKIEKLSAERRFAESKPLINKAIEVLNHLEKIADNDVQKKLISEMLLRAYQYKFGLQVKLNEPASAMKILKEVSKSTKQNYKLFLENYIEEFVLITTPSQEQLGNLYQLLSEETLFFKDRQENLEFAIARYVGALHEKFDERLSERLINAQLKASELAIDDGDLEKAEMILRNAQEQVNRLHEGAPRAPCLPALNSQILIATKILSEKFEAKAKEAVKSHDHTAETRYLQGAIRQLQQLKIMTEGNRGEQAGHCHALAKLERQRGNFYDALMEAEKAEALNPSQEEYRALIEQLSGETETQRLLADNYFREGAYDKSLKCFLNSFKSEIEKNPHRKDEIIGRLIHLADLVKLKNGALAAKGYEAAVPYMEEVTLPPKKRAEVFLFLGQEAERIQEYAKAISYYRDFLKQHPDNIEIIKSLAACLTKKGEWRNAEEYWLQLIRLRPNDGTNMFGLGNLFEEQHQFEKALNYYQKAYELDPDNSTYCEKLIQSHVEAGDQFLAKADSDPQKAINILVRIREFIEGKPELESRFHQALKGWFGQTVDNRDFRNLGKGIKDPKEIEIQAMRAQEIISKVYDGRGYYFKSGLMPQELIDLLRELRLQVAGVKGYYDKLRHETNELMELLKSSGLAQKELEGWQPKGKLQDLMSANQVKEEAQKSLTLVNQILREAGVIIPAALRLKAEQVKQLLHSYSMSEVAVPHYIKAVELSKDQYGEQINKLIEAYVQIGDYENAISAYEKYKIKFNQFPVKINPSAYINVIDRLLKGNQIEKAIEWISKASKIFPESDFVKQKMSQAIFKQGELEFNKRDYYAAFEKYIKATNLGVNADAECYAKLAAIYREAISSDLDLEKKGKLKKGEGRVKYQMERVNCLKKAADLAPNNAFYQFNFGRFVYWIPLENSFDPVPYLRKAATLEPTNIIYANALVMALSNKYDDINHPEVVKAHEHFKSLKKDAIEEEWGWGPQHV